jgi:hypothetical protein
MLLVVSEVVLLMAPVTASVVPSNVKLDWACATLEEVPVAVNTRLAAAL